MTQRLPHLPTANSSQPGLYRLALQRAMCAPALPPARAGSLYLRRLLWCRQQTEACYAERLDVPGISPARCQIRQWRPGAYAAYCQSQYPVAGATRPDLSATVLLSAPPWQGNQPISDIAWALPASDC